MRKKVLIILLSLLLLAGAMSVPVLAASWQPEDKITITVRVFDPNTGGVWLVGEDKCTKGDEYIQSDSYTIPPLSWFVGENSYRVQKVAGNWYFPSGDRNVGSVVNWSCNSSTATMTYWVPGFVPPAPSVSGDPAPTTGPTSGVHEEGSGNYTIHFTVVYHANYPGETSPEYPQYSVYYTFHAAYNITNTGRSVTVLTPAEAGFTAPNGYNPASSAWNTRADGTGAAVNKLLLGKNNDLYHLYAQWTPTEVSNTFTLKHMDGTTELTSETHLENDTVTVKDYMGEAKEGYTFRGWDTSDEADTVVHFVADTFKITAHTVLYAVWDQNEPEETFTVIYTDGVDNEEVFPDQIYKNLLSGDPTPAFSGESDTATAPTRDGYIFAGWSPEAVETVTENVTYVATWKEDRNDNGIADEEEDRYTVIYTDGVEDEVVFQDQIYKNLLSGDPTPVFNGTPEREGYTFVGWDIITADTVTGNATYTARWEQNSVKPTGDNTAAVVAAAIVALLAAATAVIITLRRRSKAD